MTTESNENERTDRAYNALRAELGDEHGCLVENEETGRMQTCRDCAERLTVRSPASSTSASLPPAQDWGVQPNAEVDERFRRDLRVVNEAEGRPTFPPGGSDA